MTNRDVHPFLFRELFVLSHEDLVGHGVRFGGNRLFWWVFEGLGVEAVKAKRLMSLLPKDMG